MNSNDRGLRGFNYTMGVVILFVAWLIAYSHFVGGDWRADHEYVYGVWALYLFVVTNATFWCVATTEQEYRK